MIAFRYICRKPPRFKYNIVNYVRFTEQRFRFKVNIWHESIQVKPIVWLNEKLLLWSRFGILTGEVEFD